MCPFGSRDWVLLDSAKFGTYALAITGPFLLTLNVRDGYASVKASVARAEHGVRGAHVDTLEDDHARRC